MSKGAMMTWNDTDELFPRPSSAVHVTVVVPTGNVDPEAGEQVDVRVAPRSVAVGALKVAIQPLGEVASCEMSVGLPANNGAVVSCTLTLNEAVESLPFPSLVVHCTTVVPIGKVEPEAGEQPIGRAPVTASVDVGLVQLTALPEVDVASCVMFAGTPLITGPVVSTTVMVKDAEAEFPCESVALQEITWGPSAIVVPDAGVHPDVATESSGSLNPTE